MQSKKWSVLHQILNQTHGMTAAQIHREVVKNRGSISASTISRWRRKARAGETVFPRFDTMQVVLTAVTSNSFAIVDENNKVLINFRKPASLSRHKKYKKKSDNSDQQHDFFLYKN